MKALEYEYKSSGVTFQCLLPFYVATRMTQYSSTLSNPSLFIPTATVYVRHALATLGWSSETPGYWPHSVQVQHFHLYSPSEGLVLILVQSLNQQGLTCQKPGLLSQHVLASKWPKCDVNSSFFSFWQKVNVNMLKTH